MTPAKPTVLVVPVDVAAVCVGAPDATTVTDGKYFAGTTAWFDDMAGSAGAFIGANVTRGLSQPPLAETAMEQGVHLHWALPDGLTHATVSDTDLAFPAAPNRWLVARFVISGSAPSAPKTWIVQSDILNTSAPAKQKVITLPVQEVSGDLGYRFAGYHQVFDASWREPVIDEDKSFKTLTQRSLSAVSSGEATFAAYYPNSRGVYGFVDALDDVSGAADLMYVVFGWYGDPSEDPLHKGFTQAQLEQAFSWTFRAQDGDTVSSLLCHGLVQSVGWDGTKQYFSTEDQQQVVHAEVAVGNNAAEALSAYYQDKLHPDSLYFQKLLTSFQIGTLSKYANSALPDRLAQLEESLHKYQFSPQDSGTIYAVTAQGSDAEGTTEPPLPLTLANDLDALNKLQQQADFFQFHMLSFRRQLFFDWYRLFKAADDGTRDTAVTIAEYMVATWSTFQTEYNTGIAPDLKAQHDKVTNSIAALNKSRKTPLTLVAEPAERYYQPNEPFVLLISDDLPRAQRYGGDGRHSEDDLLWCRTDLQALTGVAIDGTSIEASQFAGAHLPPGNQAPFAALFDTLLAESCLLNTAVAAAITGKTESTLTTELQAALVAAVNDSGGDAPPPTLDYTFVGTPPTPVGVQFWAGENPWLPLLLSYRADLAPALDTEDPPGTLHDYPSDFFTANFDVDQDSGGAVSWKSSPAIQLDPTNAGNYKEQIQGVSVLGSRTAQVFEKQLENYLAEPNNQDATLSKILLDLKATNVHGQSLRGMNDALLMAEQSLQLSVSVPTGGTSPWDQTVAQITQLAQPIIGDQNHVSPLFNGSFNPIRAGYMHLGFEVIGAFGQRRKVVVDKMVCSESMTAYAGGNPVPGTVALAPRLSQPTRLLFRWMAAAGFDDEEMNSHPASSPICGWLLSNHLDGSLFLYNQQGKALGTLYLNGDQSAVGWQSAPGNDQTVNQSLTEVMSDANPHFAALAEQLYCAGPAYFQAFWSAIDKVNAFVNPHSRASSQDLAVLIGRPVALAQCSLRLETQGPTAVNQSFAVLQGQNTNTDDANVSEVELPVIVGHLAQLNDGLIGYFKENTQKTDYDLGTFFSQGAEEDATSGAVRPSSTNILLTTSPKSNPDVSQLDVPEPPNEDALTEKLLVLLDPRASVHATTGILPTRTLSIPSSQYYDALVNLEMTFITSPILRPSSGLAMPLPVERGYTWSWVQEEPVTMGETPIPPAQPVTGSSESIRWVVDPAIERATGKAVWTYTPQVLCEGWLRLSPNLLTFDLLNSDKKPVVTSGGAANQLTLTLSNDKKDSVQFVKGTPVAEGAATTGSVFYIHLSHLMEDGDIAAVAPQADGWALAKFTDAQYGTYWAASPTADSTLDAGDSLTFTLGNVVVRSERSQAYVYFDYYGIGGLNDGAYQDLLTIQAPPNDSGTASKRSPEPGIFAATPPHSSGETSMTTNQVTFFIENLGKSGKGNDRNLIYTTTDSSYNDLRLNVTTNVETSFVAGAGKPVPISQGGSATGSLIYVDLSPLGLSDDELKKLVVAVDDSTPDNLKGWAWQIDSKVLCLAATADVATWEPTQSIVFDITGMGIANPPAGDTANLSVSYYRFKPVTILPSLSRLFTIQVSLQSAPDASGDLHQDIAVQVTQNRVLTPGSTGSVTFAFSKGSRGRSVVAGANTKFVVNFVYAADSKHGDGALTTVDVAVNDMQINPKTNASGWTITQGTDQQNPSWSLQPPAGLPIVGDSVSGVVEFEVDGIDTDFPAGLTTILITWDNDTISGYAGGTFYGLIEKAQKASIDSFTVTPNPTVFDIHGQAKVRATWKTRGATNITLMPGGRDVTHVSSYDLVLSKSTALTLIAEGVAVGTQDNRDTHTVQVEVLPVINSLRASPSSIHYRDFSNKQIKLDWDVDAAPNTVEIITSTGTDQPASSGKVDYPIQVNQPQMVTLKAGQGADTVERKVFVSAFKPGLQSISLGETLNAVAASPNHPFLAATTSAGVVLLDTLSFQPIGHVITVGIDPQGLAFSQDGSSLLVANRGSGSVSLISITGQAPTWQFSVQSVQVGGSPEQIAVTPDDSMALVTTQNGELGSVVMLKNTGGQYSNFGSVTVGKDPIGVAVSASGASAYVANSGDDTVSVLVWNNGSYQAGTAIQGLENLNAPIGVAVTPDNQTLLVACSGSGYVFAFFVDDVYSTLPTTLLVGGSPNGITVLGSGGYAFVGNSSSKVSLISCSNGYQNCKLLDASISVASGPAGITSTPAGDMVLVGGQQLSVLTLARYKPITRPNTMMSNFEPNGVAVSNDGALIWSNPFLGAPQQGGRLGVYSFTKLGDSLTYLRGLELCKFVNMIHVPGTGGRWVIAAKFEDNGVSVSTLELLDAQNAYTSALSTTLPAHGSEAREIANIAIDDQGQNLFVWTYVRSGSKQVSVLTYNLDTATSALTLGDTIDLYQWSQWSAHFSCAASADGSRFYALEGYGGNLYVIEKQGTKYALDSASPLSVQGGTPLSMVASPDGLHLYILTQSGSNMAVSTVDTQALTVSSPVPFPYSGNADEIRSMTILPDGSNLVVSDSVIGGVRFLDPKSLRVVGSTPIDSSLSDLWAVGISPDALTIVVTGINGQVQSSPGITGILPAVAPEASGGGGGGVSAFEGGLQMNAVLGDAGSFSGLFLRDYIGQAPDSPPNGSWSESPDIITHGTSLSGDPVTDFLTPGTDNCQLNGPSCNQPVQLGQDNFVYLRGLNTTSSTLTAATVTLYYTQSDLMLWPKNWTGAKIYEAVHSGSTTSPGVEKNYTVVTAAPPSGANQGWTVTNPPFIWEAPQFPPTASGGDHYCMIAFTEVGDTGKPFDLTTLPGYAQMSFDQLASLLQSTHNMAWRNTVDQQPSDGDGVHWLTNISAPEVDETLNVTLNFSGLKSYPDRYYQLQIPGPNNANYVDTGKTLLPQNGGSWELNWKANFNTYVLLRIWPGANPLEQGYFVALKAWFDGGGGPPMLAAVEEIAPNRDPLDERSIRARLDFVTEKNLVVTKDVVLIGSVYFKGS